jgi:hypothetical protein
MGAKGNLGAIYAGRFIAGLGVGQTTVVDPVYLAAPAFSPDSFTLALSLHTSPIMVAR